MAAFASMIGGASPIEQQVRTQAPQTMAISPAAMGQDPTKLGMSPMPMPQQNAVGNLETKPLAQLPSTQNEESMLILKALTDRLKNNSKSQGV